MAPIRKKRGGPRGRNKPPNRRRKGGKKSKKKFEKGKKENTERERPKAEVLIKARESSEDEDSADSDGETAYQKLMSTLSKKQSYLGLNSDEEEEFVSDFDDNESDGESIGEEENITNERGDESDSDKDMGDTEETKDEEVEKEEEEEDKDLQEMKEDSDKDIMEHSGFFNFADDDELNDKKLQDKDPMLERIYETELDEDTASKLATEKPYHITQTKLPILGDLRILTLSQSPPKFTDGDKLENHHIKLKLSQHWPEMNKEFSDTAKASFSPLQQELFSVMNSYKDFLWPERTHLNAEELRNVYCLHVLNHLLKGRHKVFKHNTQLLQSSIDKDSDEIRDQGLTRPRALIIVPYREAAHRIVNTFISLLMPTTQQNITHKKRFHSEYGSTPFEDSKLIRPDDYEATFAGNIDDHFRLGMAISKRGLLLYTEFYMSDIIIASPLGLRTIIKAEGELKRDFEFLSSIELLLLDQTDVCLMQNWEHVTHFMEHMHLQPKSSHGVDFSRVYLWALNGWQKFYRQTLMFGAINTPEITSLFNKYCRNFSGKVVGVNPVKTGSICQILLPMPQVFHKITCDSYLKLSQKRFEFFQTKTLPQFKDSVMKGTLIYIPSYFDYVKIRNYFKREDLDFTQICEYSKPNRVTRARAFFYQKNRHFMLFTERFHFNNRYRIRGIKHIIFYQLPAYPHFYSEMCNMIASGAGENPSCTILYSKYDAQRLTGVTGSQRCAHMLTSEKDVHMFISENESS